jgi:hypothetical protein
VKERDLWIIRMFVINEDFSKFAGPPLSETRTDRSPGDYILEVSDNALVIPVTA